MIILIGILGLIIGLIIAYILPKEKVKKQNDELAKQENEMRLKIKDLEKDYLTVKNDYEQKERELESSFKKQEKEFQVKAEKQEKVLSDKIIASQKQIYQQEREWQNKENEAKLRLLSLESKQQAANQAIEESKKLNLQIKEDVGNLEAKTYDLMVEEFAAAAKEAQKDYEGKKESLKKSYKDLQEELVVDYKKTCDKLEQERVKAQELLDTERAKAAAAVEANKRAELERQQKDFYRLQLSEIDLEEIKKIRSIEPYLRDKEPLNKVIWKVYYEKPYKDLIGRVIGEGKVSGIYKITNINDGKCYIGQSTDLAERWKQHMKRGVGADSPTQSKLYPAMIASGIENFTFEVIEKCKATELTEREKFYTDFYQSKNWGYGVRSG